MTKTATLERHADLVDRMAGAVGLDLEEKIMEGKLLIDTLGDAVLACTGCANPEDCAQFLAASGGQVSDTPGYCRNSDLFKALKDGKHV